MQEKFIKFLRKALSLPNADLRQQIEKLVSTADWNDPATWGQQATGMESEEDLPTTPEEKGKDDKQEDGPTEETQGSNQNDEPTESLTDLERVVISALSKLVNGGTSKQAAGDSQDAEAIVKASWLKRYGFDGPVVIKSAQRMPERGTLVQEGEDGTVKGYLLMWSDPSERDTDGEYFTKSTTDLTAIFDEMGALPAIYNHAMDSRFKSVVMGAIKSMEADDDGLWIEAQIRQHNAYKRYLQPLVKQNVLYWSSGVLPRGKKASKGHIMRWPIVEGSMTPTPAFYRGLWEDEQIQTMYKAADLPVDFLQSYNPDREAQIELERLYLLSL